MGRIAVARGFKFVVIFSFSIFGGSVSAGRGSCMEENSGRGLMYFLDFLSIVESQKGFGYGVGAAFCVARSRADMIGLCSGRLHARICDGV